MTYPLQVLNEKLQGASDMLEKYEDLVATCEGWLEKGVNIEFYQARVTEHRAHVQEYQTKCAELRDAIEKLT